MIRLTLPPEFVTDYGAGYPLTYIFDVPDTPGLIGQWSANGTTWTTITAAPAGRFDGIEAARFTADRAYLSIAFPANQNRMWVRVWDGSADVGTYRGIPHYYDDRAAGVVFTYDDWNAQAGAAEGSALHQSVALWFSGGINGGMVSSWQTLDDISAGGYFEAVNHGLNHWNALNYGTYSGGTAEEEAYADIAGGRDSILTNLASLSPQSRGHVHGFIKPNGYSSDIQRATLGATRHLSDRGTENTLGRNYARWDHENGLYAIGYPTHRTIYTTAANTLEDQQTQADRIIAGVETARARREIVHLYSYIHHWDATADSPLDVMLQTVGAHDDIWSVGWGHQALYRRLTEVIKVESLPAYRSDVLHSTGGDVVLTPPSGNVGDILVAARADASASAAQSIDGEGWTLLGSSTTGLAVWWKVAGDSEPAVTLSGFSTNQFKAGALLRIAHADTAEPIEGFARQVNSAATVATAPAVTSGSGYVLRIFKTNNNPRLMPPEQATARTLISTTSNEINLTIAEHATAGDPAPMEAPLVNSSSSVGATLIIAAGAEPAYQPMPSTDRRRGAIAAL